MPLKKSIDNVLKDRFSLVKKNGHMVQPLCLLIFDDIVKPEATSEEIEMAIDSDQAPQIFAHSVSSIFDFFFA